MAVAAAGLTGGCQCGALRYRLASAPTDASICHCRMCQKAFGSYFAPLAGVPVADLGWTRGELATYRSSDPVERGFCRDCGTPLTYRVLASDRISVSIGSLDDPDAAEPLIAYGAEGVRPAFARLTDLPGRPTSEDYAETSRQHPDHDTASWPAR